MCGIAGILRREPDGPDLAGPLEDMRHAVAHRGPDDTGTWWSPGKHAAFAHTRLSILDLSPAGHQPMSVANGRFTISYNGEVYNFKELRRELEQAGFGFTTSSDTEVILRAYEAYGPACVEKLRGMFAFALWDERERTCLLARDRFGIKPLFYYDDGRRLMFASELQALVASGMVPRELDPEGAYRYFRTGSVPEPLTLLKGVRCLEAGHHMAWHGGRTTIRSYWDLRFSVAADSGDFIAATRASLLDSMAHHFVSDVPVGIFLSGGVDSTALVALARVLRRDELRTFSLTFPGSPHDEGAAARRTAEHFGTVHHEWPLDATSGLELFDQFLQVTDQPSIDGMNTFAVSKLAHRGDTKVVLSGLGGDEIFGGYPSFEAVPRFAEWHRRARLAGPLTVAAGHAIEALGSPRWRRMGDLLRQPPGIEAAYTTFRGIYTRAEALKLTRRYAGAFEPPVEEPGAGAIVDPTPEDTVSRLEITRYMRNQLLRDSDVLSMAWGVEIRVPFLDPGVIQTVSGIPARDRLRAGKGLLLRSVPELPEWVTQQPKRGFMFPMQEWLGGAWRDTFAEMDRTCPVPTGTWYRKWCVFALDRWLSNITAPAPGRKPRIPLAPPRQTA